MYFRKESDLVLLRRYDKICIVRQEYDKFEWCNQHKYVIKGLENK